MKKTTNIILILLCLAILAGTFFYIGLNDRKPVQDAGKAVNGEVKKTELFHGEDSFKIKEHIETLLLIGTDSGLSYEEIRNNMEGKITPFYNHIQSDVLVLLVFDNDAQNVTAIQINRDTMFDVPWTDVLGNYGGTEKKQVALSYNSGSGLEDSCKNTCRTVSSLLFDAPVDHYISFTMSGINELNDLVGGVEVNISDDLTPYDPTLVKGMTVKLKGTQAESFLRSRMRLTDDDTNNARMRRHRDYFEGFMQSAREAIEKDANFTVKAIARLEPYMLTDMTVQRMSDFVEKLDTYSTGNIKYVEGELKTTQFYEFYPDMEQLWGIVRDTFSEIMSK